MKNMRLWSLASVLALAIAFSGCRSKKTTDAPGASESTDPDSQSQYVGVPPDDAVPAAAPGASADPEQTPLSLADRPAVDPAAMPAQGDLDFAEYEAWFKKHDLSLSDPGMLDADPDGDGHTNRDEFLAGTNPRDASSVPGLHPTIRMASYNESVVPVVLESVSGAKAVIRHSSGSEQAVKVGDKVEGTSFKVVRFAAVADTDKEGQTLDISRIVLEDAASGKRVTLVKDMPARSSDSYAVLEAGGERVNVQQGGEFSMPGEPDRKYQVLDIRPAQVVVKEVGADAVWTIPKTSGATE